MTNFYGMCYKIAISLIHLPYENILLEVTSTEFNAPIWFKTAQR